MKQTLWNGDKTIGNWSVQDTYIVDPKGNRRWLCRCQCGTERYVLERSLKYGGSKSCGCATRERARQANTYQLRGEVFGDLTVLYEAKNQRKNGGKWWTCQCACGALCDVPGTLLVTGRKRNCGCSNVKNYAFCDVAGQRFEMLTALFPQKERDHKGGVIWHCKCDCGNEVDVSYNELVYSMRKSCGCQKKKHDQELHESLTRVAGTSLDMIASKKTPANNTSGIRGVYYSRGKWCAKIVFQKRQYQLGQYTTIEEAAQARKAAEELLFDGAVTHYTRWKEKADSDPAWAADNPIEILVQKRSANEIGVTFLPVMA